MIGDKVKGLLAINGKNVRSFCDYLEIMEQAGSRKVKNSTFKVEEFIKLADLTGTHLAFIDDNGKPVITFDLDDIPSSKKQ